MRLLLILFILIGFHSSSADTFKDKVKQFETNIIFLRHALAPGVGDPVNFNLGNCRTQRNLNDVGRLQAKKIGQALQLNGINFAEIFSSEWCRCKETANLLDIGNWQTFGGLNSFFQNRSNRNHILHSLNIKMKNGEKNKLYLFVTHQVVISAVTGINAASGELVAYNPRTGYATKLALSGMDTLKK